MGIRFEPDAHNPRYPDDSYGLLQINMDGPMGEDVQSWLKAMRILTHSPTLKPFMNHKD